MHGFKFQRDFLRIGCGLHPGTEINFSVHSISNLTKIKIVYSGWISNIGKQLNNHDLNVLSSHYPKLVDRTLSYCSFSDDTGLGLGQNNLVILGPGWNKLKRLEFELDANYGYREVYTQWAVSRRKSLELCCENLTELILVNYNLDPLRPLSHVLGMYGALQNLSLDLCHRLEDSHMIALSQNFSKLRRILLKLSPRCVSVDEPFRLTDNALKELACGCSMLEEFELSFPGLEISTLLLFRPYGLIKLIQSCPIRKWTLNVAGFFNGNGMDALCSAPFLEVLEIVKCQDVTDRGIQKILSIPSLNRLKISKGLGVGDAGIKPLVKLGQLEYLIVEDCFFDFRQWCTKCCKICFI